MNTQNKTLCILAEARSGTEFLSNLIASDPNFYLLGEFFTPFGSNNIKTHVELLSQMIKNKHIDLSCYSNYMGILADHIKNHNLGQMYNTITIEMFEVIKEYLYSINKNIVVKIFDNHLTNQLINKKDLLNSFDYIILNYRKSLLDTYISLSKALITSQWYVDSEDKIINPKIIWNKQKYLEFYKKSTERYLSILEMYRMFDKGKIIWCYEDFHTLNDKEKKLEQALKDIGLNIKLTLDPQRLPVKQSKPTNNYDDIFENPIEFLKDLEEIKDKTTIFLA